MKVYHGNRGIVGFIAFALTGIIYTVLGFGSKIVGKILFAIFVVMIPAIFKLILEIIGL